MEGLLLESEGVDSLAKAIEQGQSMLAIGEIECRLLPQPVENTLIDIAPYSPIWPERFAQEAAWLRAVLQARRARMQRER